MPRIGKLLRLWRVNHDVEQKTLAKDLGITASSLCRLEAGKAVDMQSTVKVIDWLFMDCN